MSEVKCGNILKSVAYAVTRMPDTKCDVHPQTLSDQLGFISQAHTDLQLSRNSYYIYHKVNIISS